MKTDIVFINPGNRRQVFQNLADDYSAVEPPYWVAALAAYVRSFGFSVQIIDANADSLTPAETAVRAKEMSPKLVAIIVYGSQPSASTQNMTIAGEIARAVRHACDCPIAMGGLHPSALPERTMREEEIDYLIDGEGAYTITALLIELSKNVPTMLNVPGLWYREGTLIRSNPRPASAKNIDEILPVAAWDLLPMDKYRAHNWHCFDDIEHREPYAALYTSLGCPYSCVFCCINAPFGKPMIRYRSPEMVLADLDVLATRYNVKNIKIIDELFILHERHYMPILEGILQKGYVFNIWAYARVDTVLPKHLPLLKRAGVNWLALGIESANPDVRDGASKKMRVADITRVVRMIQDAGIRVIGNYIFGLPDDTMSTMQETLDLALSLNCEFANFYCAMAYPGSKLFDIAVAEKWELPSAWHGFSQHSYELLPLPSKTLSAKDILQFRDASFSRYYSHKPYLDMLEKKFSVTVRSHIEHMNSVRLKRALLGDSR